MNGQPAVIERTRSVLLDRLPGLLPGSVTALMIIATTGTAGAASTAAPTSDDAFCTRVQELIAGTTVPSHNNLYDDYPAFRKSKTAVSPLETHQHVLRKDGKPLRVSCKIKTPDHLLVEYGPLAAKDRGLTCRDVNRDTTKRVYASLSPAERASATYPPARILLDADDTKYMGSSWVGDYELAYLDTNDKLHLKSKALRVDWDNVWLSWAPDRLRGAYYCHLIAPEYLRDLMLGAPLVPVTVD